MLAAHSNAPGAGASNARLHRASGLITAVVFGVLLLKAVVLRPRRFWRNKANRMDLLVVPVAFALQVRRVSCGEAPSPRSPICAS